MQFKVRIDRENDTIYVDAVTGSGNKSHTMKLSEFEKTFLHKFCTIMAAESNGDKELDALQTRMSEVFFGIIDSECEDSD